MRAYEEACRTVAKELGLPYKFVKRTYMAYWTAVKEHIESLPLKEDLSDDEYNKLQPNVNIPSIGKLHVTLDRYKRIKKSYKAYRNLVDKNNKENDTHKED